MSDLLPPIWETQVRLLAPGFDLVTPKNKQKNYHTLAHSVLMLDHPASRVFQSHEKGLKMAFCEGTISVFSPHITGSYYQETQSRPVDSWSEPPVRSDTMVTVQLGAALAAIGDEDGADTSTTYH